MWSELQGWKFGRYAWIAALDYSYKKKVAARCYKPKIMRTRHCYWFIGFLLQQIQQKHNNGVKVLHCYGSMYIIVHITATPGTSYVRRRDLVPFILNGTPIYLANGHVPHRTALCALRGRVLAKKRCRSSCWTSELRDNPFILNRLPNAKHFDVKERHVLLMHCPSMIISPSW